MDGIIRKCEVSITQKTGRAARVIKGLPEMAKPTKKGSSAVSLPPDPMMALYYIEFTSNVWRRVRELCYICL